MTNFPVPYGNKLIVEPLEKKEEALDSGIIMAATANAELMEAKVVAVSQSIKALFSPGDTVLYPSRKGVGQMFGGKAYLWLDATVEKEEIWGVKIDGQ